MKSNFKIRLNFSVAIVQTHTVGKSLDKHRMQFSFHRSMNVHDNRLTYWKNLK